MTELYLLLHIILIFAVLVILGWLLKVVHENSHPNHPG